MRADVYADFRGIAVISYWGSKSYGVIPYNLIDSVLFVIKFFCDHTKKPAYILNISGLNIFKFILLRQKLEIIRRFHPSLAQVHP